MSNSDSGASATDIITYIGVPLAVLGVLPILYNTVATLAALSKIKSMLKYSKLPALTRSDVVNRVIEVELPRYAVTPWDRFNERSEYWQLSRQPSQIPGGSWTAFNWKTNTIGIKTQRVEYADQLRQPQVEVAFDELVSYLLDLGAVPDAHGWKLLRSAGLWTPRGSPLMMSPDGHKALTIAPLDDSDGHLSLAVNWSPAWTTRNYSSLPPYWVRFPPPPLSQTESVATGECSTSEETLESEHIEEGKSKTTSLSEESADYIQRQSKRNETSEITCQISVDGIVTALTQQPANESSSSPSSSSIHSLYIEHLRLSHINHNGVWFASAATAYGTTSQTVLWNYTIPEPILSFARRDTVPCGVLVLLGVVNESDTPQWATGGYDAADEAHELFVKRSAEQRMAMQAEARMSNEARQVAVKERMQREMAQRMQDMRDKQRLDAQRREARTSEALQSPKWDNKLVAEHNLDWLRKHGHIKDDGLVPMKDVVGHLLHRMILDGQFASSVCKMLDLWKAWADNGGMRRSDYVALRDAAEDFARASLLVALIKDNTTAAHDEGGSLPMDLQECVRMWRTVRLG